MGVIIMSIEDQVKEFSERNDNGIVYDEIIDEIKENVDKLYNDLNFTMDNVRYCSKLKEVLSEKSHQEESQNYFNFSDEFMVYNNKSHNLERSEVLNNYPILQSRDSFVIDYDDKLLQFDKHIVDNVQNYSLFGMVNMISDYINNNDYHAEGFYADDLEKLVHKHLNTNEPEVSLGNFEVKVINTKKHGETHNVDKFKFDYIFPYNFKKDTAEKAIKEELTSFVLACSDGNEEAMEKSLKNAMMLANFFEKYSMRWLNRKVEKILLNEFEQNQDSKLESLKANMNFNQFLEADKEYLQNKIHNLMEIGLKIDEPSSRIDFEFKDAFKDYCDGKNDDFVTFLKVEMPYQKLAVEEYNKEVREIKEKYNSIVLELGSKDKERLKNIRNIYGVKKLNRQEQSLQNEQSLGR